MVVGENGDDIVAGGLGDDLLFGSAGDDDLDGGFGDDVLYGEEGDDMGGGPGDDLLAPGPGVDHVNGGLGNDVVLLTDVSEIVAGKVLRGGAGRDLLITPVPVAQLRAAGVVVEGFEDIVVHETPSGLRTPSGPLFVLPRMERRSLVVGSDTPIPLGATVAVLKPTPSATFDYVFEVFDDRGQIVDAVRGTGSGAVATRLTVTGTWVPSEALPAGNYHVGVRLIWNPGTELQVELPSQTVINLGFGDQPASEYLCKLMGHDSRLPRSLRVYGTDLGFSAKIGEQIHFLFGDTWQSTTAGGEGPLYPTDAGNNDLLASAAASALPTSSKACPAVSVPASGGRYWVSTDPSAPSGVSPNTWSLDPMEARPVNSFDQEVKVTGQATVRYDPTSGLWWMMYGGAAQFQGQSICRASDADAACADPVNTSGGVYIRSSPTPWGPWAPRTVLYSSRLLPRVERCTIFYDPNLVDLGLPGFVGQPDSTGQTYLKQRGFLMEWSPVRTGPDSTTLEESTEQRWSMGLSAVAPMAHSLSTGSCPQGIPTKST